MMFKKEYLIFFTAFILLFSKNLISFCKLYYGRGFDYQALLAWDFAAGKGLTIYKDTFFPYGLLYYLRNQDILVHLIYVLLPIFFFFIVFLTLKKLFKGITSYALFFLFAVFIFQFSGIENFTRNGISFVFSILLAFLSGKKILQTKPVFLLGVSTGLILGFSTDQAFFICPMLLLFSIFILLNTKPSLKPVVKSLFMFFFGSAVGFFPIFAYLFSKGAFSDFLISLSRLSDIAQYAKTPFSPFSRTPENIFSFVVLFTAWLWIFYKIVQKKQILSFITLIQFGLTCLLILYEQKSLIRSIDRGLTFISLFILFTLIAEVKNGKTRLIILFLVFIFFETLFHKTEPLIQNYYFSQKECITKNIDIIVSADKSYSLVNSSLEENKIFSFPADPAFYVIFNQNPPYYSNNYDSSPLYAQKKQIDYLIKNKVEYVIYDLLQPFLEDEVPNYIRTPLEFKYILSNYSFERIIGHFLILKKNKDGFEFNSENQSNFNNFLDYLTNVDLKNIPRSEGTYKQRSILKGSVIFSGKPTDLKSFLSKDTVNTTGLFIKIKFKKTGNNYEKITIFTQEGKSTTVLFYPCVGFYCLVDLSNIPLFYKDKVIENIILSNEENISILELVKVIDKTDLW